MWTMNTHTLTTAVWLPFELIVSRDIGAPTLIDGQESEIWDLARKASAFPHENQARSCFANQGVSLIDTLLDKGWEIGSGEERRFNLVDITTHVAGNESEDL
jgi:hypothetical protein